MSVDRLIAFVRRELGAEDVRVVPLEDELPEHVVEAEIPGGRRVMAVFDAPIEDREAKTRRLEMLVESFGETLRGSVASPSRPPPSQTLHEELQSLAERAGAIDALVIDARSPVVWGAAGASSSSPQYIAQEDNVIQFDPLKRASGERPSAPTPSESLASQRAIELVRNLPQAAMLHKGGHIHNVVREEHFGLLAKSFASIYVLMLVFEKPFDELGAERAIAVSLPTIERLVTMLPPLDPSPVAGAAAIRRRRR